MEEKQHAGMRRGVLLQSSMVQQMVEGKPTWWWSTNGGMRPPPQPTFSLQPSSSSSSSSRSSSSSSVCPQFSRPSNTPMTSWQDGQGIPESWCQLLFGGLAGEEEKHGLMMPLQTKKTMNCEQRVYPSAPAQIADTEQELFGRGYVHMSRGNEQVHASKSTWSQVLPASSPNSCITTGFSTNVLTFSSKADQLPDTSSECNSIETAPAFKKARLEGSSSPKSNPKVRKEKLGERLTALHQIVSPFGKTDTASVLLEAIGYIRFLHSQIEVLSSSYLPPASGDLSQPMLNENGTKNSGEQDQECNDEQKKDLRSRGLCLVPVAFMMHVGSGNGADLCAPALGGGFR